MKNKSILSRAGIVLLILLVLVLILPSGKIDLASKISASTQASVRAEHQQNFPWINCPIAAPQLPVLPIIHRRRSLHELPCHSP